MITNIAGTPARVVGEIVDLPNDVAAIWIREGLATRVAANEFPTGQKDSEGHP